MFDVKRLFRSLMLVGVGLFMLWQSVETLNRNRRIDVNPHAQATVQRTWTSSGKHPSRYADVSFPGPIGIGLCHATGVLLGSSWVPAQVGHHIDVVPIPGSCATPDAPTARQPGWLVSLEFAGAFTAFLFGVFALLGLPSAIRTTPTGFARRYG